jgi:hypothetical protein
MRPHSIDWSSIASSRSTAEAIALQPQDDLQLRLER